jgi:type I restriction enzyme S subunit
VTIPVWAVVSERRTVVEPDLLGIEVAHYSIPNVDAFGGAAVEASGDIRSAKLAVQAGDVLISRLNPRKPRVVTVQRHAVPAVASTEFIPLAPHRVDPRFLHCFLSSDATAASLDARVQSVTRSHQRVDAEVVLRLRLPGLESHQQRRIAGFLDEQVVRLDAALGELRALAHTADLQRTSRLAEAYEDLPSPDFLEGRTPTPVVSLRGLTAAMLSGGTPATGEPSYWDDEGLPWIAIGDMVDGGTTQATHKGLSPAGLAAARLRPAPPGTVLFAMYASVGKTTVTGMAAAWNQAILGLVPRHGVDPDFLLGWLELARPSLPAIARSATQDNLNADQVARLRVPRRTTAEQQRIGVLRRAAVEDHARLLAMTARLKRLVEERKRALITACVTGEFDVSTASARAGDVALTHLPPGLGEGSVSRALQ